MRIREVLVAGLVAQAAAVAQGTATARPPSRDTMPEHVVARGDDAFNRQDGRGSLGTPRPWGPDSVLNLVQHYWASQKQPPHIRVDKRITSGRFVAVVYRYTDDHGTRPLLEVYEVKNGLIVHEWAEQ